MNIIRFQKLEESGKEVVVVATRVDAETCVNELIENTDLNPNEVDEGQYKTVLSE